MADGGARSSNFGPSDVFGLPARPSNFEEEIATASRQGGGPKDLHMLVQSSNNSLIFDVFVRGGRGANHDYGVPNQSIKEFRMAISPGKVEGQRDGQESGYLERDDFRFRYYADNPEATIDREAGKTTMSPASVMTRLILIMVWRKLIRNPNTYSSLTGLVWSFESFKWNLEMPAIVAKSIAILSDAGLGMAMFSLRFLARLTQLQSEFDKLRNAASEM